jgi:hypothetical protein
MHIVTISLACLVGAFVGGLLFGAGAYVGQQLPPEQAGYHIHPAHHHGQHHHPQQHAKHQWEATP